MKKRGISLFLCLCMLLALLPGAVAPAAALDEFSIENGVLIRYKGYSGDVTIPGGVTSIGDNAFSRCAITSVTIPNSVTSIGDHAFVCCKLLTEVTIPGSVTSVSPYAFAECDRLASVTIENGVTEIGERMFHRCGSLTSVTIPNSVTSIGRYAFSYCAALTSLAIPDSVTSIGADAFSNSGLTSVTVPASVTEMEDAFSLAKSLTSATFLDGATCIGKDAFYNCTSLTDVTIPNSVTSIEYGAFRGSGLTSVTIPSSVTSIGRSAFSYCKALTDVTILDGVTDIGEDAFYGCSSLSSVTIPASVTKVGWSAFAHCNSLKDVYYGGTEEQWNAILIGDYNDPLTAAAVHYTGAAPKPAEPEKPVSVAYPSAQAVTIDGKQVEFQMYALRDAGGNPTNYVKVRDLALALNGTKAQFSVGWDGAVNLESGKEYDANGSENSTPFSGERSYTLPTNPTSVNGAASDLTAIVLTDDDGGGYTYYKLRDLGSKLGFNVDWSADKGIFIETDKPYSSAD